MTGIWLRGPYLPQRHACQPPEPEQPGLTVGDDGAVWQCDCGRRWTLHVDWYPQPPIDGYRCRWVRRWWPWPRQRRDEPQHGLVSVPGVPPPPPKSDLELHPGDLVSHGKIECGRCGATVADCDAAGCNGAQESGWRTSGQTGDSQSPIGGEYDG